MIKTQVELTEQQLHGRQGDRGGIRVSADGHHERVEKEILDRRGVVSRAGDDLARDLEARIRVLDRAALVVAERNDRRAALLRQGMKGCSV